MNKHEYDLQKENELLRSTIVKLQYKLALNDSIVTFPEIDDEHCIISGFSKYINHGDKNEQA